MDPLEALAAGDRRSIGAVPTVVEQVRRFPDLFPRLVEGLDDPRPGVRMRAADAIEKLTRDEALVLRPHRRRLLRVAEATTQIEVRWHLAVLLPRLSWSRTSRPRVVRILRRYLADTRSSIVRALALQGLADLAQAAPELLPAVRRTLARALRGGTPAMRARARRLSKALARQSE